MAGGALLQNAATSGNGNEINCLGIDGKHVLTVIGAGTITAGGVTWEEALTPGYTGTWRAIAPEILPVSATVVQAVYDGPLHIVRARISTNITGSGGSVTVKHQPADGHL